MTNSDQDETMYAQGSGRAPVEERITPFSTLYLALPTEFQRADVLDALSERYYHEISCLWRSVRDDRCVRGAVELRPWRLSGSQWICEFMSYDLGAEAGPEHNWHLQNTSQWNNKDTGWAGHQGALVLNTRDGTVSSHH